MLVTKNEASRYLSAVLEWNRQYVNQICVYDDRSDDATRDVARSFDCDLRRRDLSDPSFMEDESMFRENAWRWMERAVKPEEGDWILALDADEFLVHPRGVEGVHDAIEWANELGFDGLVCNIPEIVDAYGDTLYRRVDGFWDTIRDLRLVKWKPQGYFLDRKMACGSVPTNITSPAMSSEMHILHVGHLDPKDRQAKYDRYKDLPGHNPTHVASILQPGRVEKWEGVIPFSSTSVGR